MLLAASLSPLRLVIFPLTSFPACSPPPCRKNLYSPPCSVIITWSSAIPTKRWMPPPPTRAPRNFSVCQNALHYCASARSFIQRKELSFFMFSDFIAPIDTTSSSADIDSPNSFASYHICVSLRFCKKTHCRCQLKLLCKI